MFCAENDGAQVGASGGPMVGSGALQLTKRPGRKPVCASIQADRPVGAATGGVCKSLGCGKKSKMNRFGIASRLRGVFRCAGLFVGVVLLPLLALPGSIYASNWTYSPAFQTLTNGNWTISATAKAATDTNGIPYQAITIGKPSVYAADGILDLTGSVVGDEPSDTAMYRIMAIGASAFQGATYLKELHLPTDLTSIGDNAFLGINGIEKILGLSDNTVENVGGAAFNSINSGGNSKIRWADIIPPCMKNAKGRLYSYTKCADEKAVFPAVETFSGDWQPCGETNMKEVEFLTTNTVSLPIYTFPTVMKATFHTSSFGTMASGGAFSSGLTNLTFKGGVPSQNKVDYLLVAVAGKSAGAYTATVVVDGRLAGWWHMMQTFSADDITSGKIPPDCFGVYATEGGVRKGWLVAENLGSVAVETISLLKDDPSSYAVHVFTGSENAKTLTNTAATGGVVEQFNFATHSWQVVSNFTGTSVTYNHPDTLSRIVWTVAGSVLSLSQNGYAGTVQVLDPVTREELTSLFAGRHVYATGTSFLLSAAGADADYSVPRPGCSFAHWSGDIGASNPALPEIVLTLDSDKSIAAAFAPDAWFVAADKKSMTDGAWTLACTVKSTTCQSVTIGKPSIYQTTGVLNLALPVRSAVESNTDVFVFESIASSAFASETKVKAFYFPASIITVGGSAFASCKGFTKFEGFSTCGVTSLPSFTFSDIDARGSSVTWEDFIPQGLTEINTRAFYNAKVDDADIIFASLRKVATDLTVFNGAGITFAEFQSAGPMEFSGRLLPDGCKNMTFQSGDFLSMSVRSLGVLTNLTITAGVPDAGQLDNAIDGTAVQANGVCSLQIQVDATDAGWWHLAQPFSDVEIAAGKIPANCFGVYETKNGLRKGWLVADDGLGNVLIETISPLADGNDNCTVHAVGVEPVSLSNSAAIGGVLQEFDSVTRKWTDVSTFDGTTYIFTPSGRLSRVVWTIDACNLSLTVNCALGSVTVLDATTMQPPVPVVEGLSSYARGTRLLLRAVNRPADYSAPCPEWYLKEWIGDIGAVDATASEIEVAMDTNRTISAEFAPREWILTNSDKNFTDGYYIATVSGYDSIAKTLLFNGATDATLSYDLLVDLSLPVVKVSSGDACETNWIVGSGPAFHHVQTVKRIKFGPRFASFGSIQTFQGSTVLTDVIGLGQSSVKRIPNYTFYQEQSAPICAKTYEADEFVPHTLVDMNDGNWLLAKRPRLRGTLKLPHLTSAASTVNGFNEDAVVGGITNVLLTSKDLQTLSSSFLQGMRLESLSFGATNLVSLNLSFGTIAQTNLHQIVFLAHPPARAALDALLASFAKLTTTLTPFDAKDETKGYLRPLVISASRYTPGWKELRLRCDPARDTAPVPPGVPDVWGVYETSGGARFYLSQPQEPLEYDERPGFILFLR